MQVLGLLSDGQSFVRTLGDAVRGAGPYIEWRDQLADVDVDLPALLPLLGALERTLVNQRTRDGLQLPIYICCPLLLCHCSAAAAS